MSLLFGRKQIGISVVSAQGEKEPQLLANKFSLPQPRGGALPHILEAMVAVCAKAGPNGALPDLTRALLCCVEDLADETPAPEPEGRAQAFFERICVYLQSNYQYDITRDSVAQQFGVSPNHLSRLFHTQGHMTFINYLTHVRIARSKYLLCNYGLKLEDVGARCGFRDAPYFCRVFKRVTKTTPVDYRDRMTQQVRQERPEGAQES
jgi:AraC-like DNA-binding protein